jgi:hypothetical protein
MVAAVDGFLTARAGPLLKTVGFGRPGTPRRAGWRPSPLRLCLRSRPVAAADNARGRVAARDVPATFGTVFRNVWITVVKATTPHGVG